MITNDLSTAISQVQIDCDEYLYTHYEYLTSDEGADWYSTEVRLLSETQVFGRPINDYSADGQGTDTQLPLFALCPQLITLDSEYWLYNAASSTNWSTVTTTGICSSQSATTECGVRIYILVKGA